MEVHHHYGLQDDLRSLSFYDRDLDLELVISLRNKTQALFKYGSVYPIVVIRSLPQNLNPDNVSSHFDRLRKLVIFS
jgi:hypothetical protein